MSDVRDMRRKLTIALVVMALLSMVAVAILLSPRVGSASARRAEQEAVFLELKQKTEQVEPLRGLDKKIILAHGQIDQFYKERLSSTDSTISEELGKLAAANGVRLSQVKYTEKDDELAVGLRPVFIEADLTGDYLALVRFVNALERDQIFFIVDSVELAGEQNGQVKLGMKLETYQKTGV